MDLLFNISHVCKRKLGNRLRTGTAFALKSQAFAISSEDNEFVTGTYHFSVDHLRYFPLLNTHIVIDWKIGSDKCEISKKSPRHACRLRGKPYHPDGCVDINECKTGQHSCISPKKCRNTIGNYTCFCHKWQSGNGRKEGGCNIHTMVIVGAAAGFVILFVGTAMPYLIYQKRKLVKLKEKFFQQNGGLILLQKLSTSEKSSRFMQIFTEEELKKATRDFDESSIVGKGGFGTVFKGFLEDNRTVAIKKSKIVDDNQKEQFINEVIVLSQINHRNVVRLLGCCLETKVPLLVYEFVNNGTLFDLIHTERTVNGATWKTRVRIAAEAAGALSYLHSEASIPIIHRDVKTANILLDNTYTAKVSDFGASILIPLDQTALSTFVQGTFGYLDPEYVQTGQLTEKSDVYSFGAVLIELLTGEKPYSFGKPGEKKNLANHFLSSLKEDRLVDVLQVGILNEENEKEIKKVAFLAAKCLRLKGEERPSMKEVAIELQKHHLINTDPNQKENEYQLVHEAPSNIYESGDSNSHQGLGSIGDQVLAAMNDGR
uniref:Protein kinase domain-containing protein n=1 Tax=Glycine max TaxID=3847 RepID=A0A0R0GDX2_SOYBN